MGAITLGYTEGTGSEVSADLVDMGAGSAAVQHMKIVDGTDGGTVPVVAEEGYGLRVHRTRRILREQIVPTIDTSAYTADNTLFEPTEITNLIDASMGSGSVETVVVSDGSVQSAGFDVYLMNAEPAGAYVANTPFTPTDADLATVVGLISIATADYTAEGLAQWLTPIPFWVPSGTSLWALAVVRDTPTYASATDLTLNFTFQGD